MKRIKTVGLAFVAMLALGAVAASAVSAHDFKSTEAGSLLAESVSNQEFTTSAGTVTCTKLSVLNTSAVILTETQEATVDYSGCTAFFFFEAKIAPVLYDFNANETATLLKDVTIEVPADNCKILVPAQAGLKTVKYDNVTRNGHKGIELLPNVGGIKSSGSGGCSYAEEAKGTYTGNSFVWLEKGGTLTWG